ncbi:MAG: HypC/HybG/HupF family hydrogenase formation chaperone [Candidatus Ratteibacteria bacterium]|nr:HypC/HybG/HupF family hydrogenase formation chaperone [Candidatus Ratteibacteria bacterium]
MCLALPTKVIKIDSSGGSVELGGVKRKVNLELLDNVKVGEYVIVHAGFAIQKVDQKEAKETLELLKEMAK